MIRPPRGSWSFMMRNASRVQRKAPVRLTSTTRRQSATVRFSSGTGGAPVPALLNRTSSRPNVRLVVSNRARTEDSSVTSVGTARARPGTVALWPRVTVSSSASGRRPASTTSYPSARRASAVARPIPDPAPVMIAVFPFELIATSPPPLDRQPVEWCGSRPSNWRGREPRPMNRDITPAMKIRTIPIPARRASEGDGPGPSLALRASM